MNDQSRKLELLSPAGNLEKLKTAFAFGADAVYCGVPDFSLRVRINEFDLNSLKEGIEYAHGLGKKVYITVNIFAHNFHLPEIEKYLLELKKINPDALIVSDPGVLALIKETWPDVEIHLSTQANCTNWRAAKFWFDHGIKRIILGREVTLDQIKQIHEKVPQVELECFVHGAMCVSYSGRCLLSKYYMDKSANLGDCVQPCRWKYEIGNRPACAEASAGRQVGNGIFVEEVKRPGELLEMDEDEHGTYVMNSKDLCLLEYLKELADAGVSGFKIEGRAKSVYYVANTAKVYRQAIDMIDDWDEIKVQELKNELKKNINRGFTTGFLFGRDNAEQRYESGHEACEWEFVGTIIGSRQEAACLTGRQVGNSVAVRVHNCLRVGDEVELVVPVGENFTMKISEMFDARTGEALSEAHGGQDKEILILIENQLPEFTVLRKKVTI
ncbi:MAG: peptidase U32 family protein [Patescibacteria group bacterium]